MARDDDELAALSDEIERTDPRLAGALTRFHPSSRPFGWAAAIVVVLLVPAVGWLLDVRVVVAVMIVLVLASPLVVLLAMPRSVPPGGAAH